MADIVESLKLLFDRPNEPLITPKGDNKAVFQLSAPLVVSKLFIYVTLPLRKYRACVRGVFYRSDTQNSIMGR